jgi:hypothetical protein
LVYQATGGTINYTIYINKANSADNFSGVTSISTSSAQPADTATSTNIKLENVSMGACGNGIEIIIKVECGAVTLKNFQFTELQLEISSTATNYEFRSFEYESLLTGLTVNAADALIKTDIGLDFSIATAKKFFLDNGSDTYIFCSSANVIQIVSGASSACTINGSYFQIGTDWNLAIPATKKFYLNGGGGDTYISEAVDNQIHFYAGNNKSFEVRINEVDLYVTLFPSGTTLSCGGASDYFDVINYKTLTKRGGWGFFDAGVELQDGTIVSDCEAILQLKEDTRGKKTPYGKNIIDQRTLPKVVYSKAKDKLGVDLPRDEKGYAVGGEDGEDVNAMVSIMIGAIKELTSRVKALEAIVDDQQRIIEDLAGRIAALEK